MTAASGSTLGPKRYTLHAMPQTDSKGRVQLQPAEAMKSGWRSWITLLVIAAAALIIVLLTQPVSNTGQPGGIAGWVVVGVAIAWLVLMGAVVLLLRSYCFRAVWDARPVEPGSYLKGMYQVWGVLVTGCLLAVLGALLMGSLMPGGLVVMVAVLLLAFARPSGRALGV